MSIVISKNYRKKERLRFTEIPHGLSKFWDMNFGKKRKKMIAITMWKNRENINENDYQLRWKLESVTKGRNYKFKSC